MTLTAWDSSRTPTEPIFFTNPAAAEVELISADPRLEAVVVTQGTLTLLADVPDEGAFDAFLAMKIDGNFVTCGFHKGMERQDFLDEVARCLPPGFDVKHATETRSEVLILEITRARSTGGSPEVSFLSTDPSQNFRWQGKNKFTIEGKAARNLSIRSELELSIEGRTVRLVLNGGDQPIATALKLRNALPPQFSALIELPLFSGAEVTVTILRRKASN